ncbi:MAG: hypothetical protein SOT46_11140 [Treponema sp.]|nr:hypothetical protein [Treponema sp.]
MKRNFIFLLVLIFAGSLFAQNAVDYVKKWEGRNTLLASGENNLHESGEINQKKSEEKSHYQF